jgi:type VI secretion system secreted protein VgrG
MADSSERQLRLQIDAGGEQIDLLSVDSSEALSQHFHVVVEVLAPLGEVDWLPHLGKPIHVGAYEDDVFQRHFHGLLCDASFLDEVEGAGFRYRLILRPKAFFHEQGRSFRIFQNKTVRAILEDMFGRCGIAVEFGKLAGGQRNRSYCVQYGESDFGFICRLMEEEGIYYFYKHGETAHTLVLCDGSSSHDTGTASPLIYSPDSAGVSNPDAISHAADQGHRFVQSWHERVSTGGESKITMRDFDFMQPSKPLEAQATADTGKHPEDEIEVYQFPGRFYDEGVGGKLTDAVLKSRRANRRVFSGESQCGALECGAVFKFENHPHDRFDGKYMLTYVTHSFAIEQYRSGMGHGGRQGARFEAVLADVPWRAPITTRRPVVLGPETAIVTGPPGEKIYVDNYCRVCVQFHWDRDGKRDEHSSCMIRVSQTGGLGNMIIPRVGHEVLVDFINGDPDRPIIVGRVFNQDHMPTYPLPEHKTKHVWRTERYGSPGDYGEADKLDVDPVPTNEFRLDDKGGEEEIFTYAQRDMNTRVRHDQTNHVGRNQEIKVGYDRTIFVKNNETTDIKEHRKTTIGKTDTLEIEKMLTTKVTNGDEERNISGKQTIDVGGEITITAGTKITLKVGSSTVVIDQTSVKIDATMLEFTATTKGDFKALNATVDGTAMTVVKGAIVKIN